MSGGSSFFFTTDMTEVKLPRDAPKCVVRGRFQDEISGQLRIEEVDVEETALGNARV